MRKNIFGIAVAMFAMLSACETINTQEGVVGNGAQVTVSDRATLTASIGTDTKTYLEWDGSVYKTRWAEDDDIIVVDQNIDLTASDYEEYCCWFGIDEGAGESTATFVADEENFVLPDNFFAVYGEIWPEETGQWMLRISRSQGRELYENKDGEIIQGFYGQSFPMVAFGNATSSVEFKNLCSVLKVNITGDGEILQNVKVESLDEGVYLSGDARLNLEDSRPTLTFSPEPEGENEVSVYNYINFYPKTYSYDEEYGSEEVEAVLSSDPVECYIVLPAQTYPSGLKLTIQTDEGLMEVNTEQNLVFTKSELREIANISYETMTPVEDIPWYMETKTGGNSWSSCQMSYKEGMCVVEDFYVDMNTSANIRFQDINGIYYGCSSQYRENRYKTNTCISLVSGDSWYCFNLSLPGYYDIYLDPASGCVFLMSDGYTPDDLPTKEVVVYEYYNDIYNYALVDSYVKIHGPVLAKCNYGFIVAIDGYYYNNIYVFDPSNLCDVELGDWVDVCAKRADYRFLPELKITEGDYFCQVIYSSNMNYDSEPANRITDYATYSSSSYSYEYISYEGTLEISGIYNNIIFDGVEGYKGSITKQGTDLSEFNGKKVYVEGYYAGSNTSNGVTYINIILKKIMLYNEDTVGGGTTEEILPGDSFPVSNPVLRR